MKSVVGYLEEWAAKQPDKCLFAFVDIDGNERETYTYRGFHEGSRNLAHYLLRNIGLKSGERVLLAYPPGLDLILAFFGCARIGVIPVPVYPPTPMNFEAGMAKLRLIAMDCQARAALSTRRSSELIRRIGAQRSERSASQPAREAQEIDWIATDDVSAEAPGSFRNDPNEVLFLQYTSGSTGDPRGVVVLHENVVHNASSTVDYVPIRVSWLPQYHDMGLIGYYVFAVIVGGTTYGLSPLDFLKRPTLWLRTISRVRATYASSPNFGFEHCLRPDKVTSEQLRGVDLSSLRVLMNAAEPVRPETCRRFFERFAPYGLRPEANVAAYGLAENTLAVTNYGRRILAVDRRSLRENVARIEDARSTKDNQVDLASCGRPIDGVRVRIVDPKNRAVLPERGVGEIWVAGSSVCRGYWERPQSTQAVFHNRVVGDPGDTNSYLRTGDLGFFHEGELFVCGRIKELIIIRGVNYYPQDIETVVESVSSKIRRGGVAAFGGGDDEATLVVVAEVTKPRALPDPAAIARAIRTRCGVEADAVVLVRPRTISRTTSGKTARRLTRERYLSGKLPSLLTHRPPTASRSTGDSVGLRTRFHYVFALCDATVGEASSFAEMGMDSLKLAQFQVDLECVLQEQGAADLIDEIDIPLLQHLTVAEFSRLLEKLEEGSERSIAACRSDLRRIRTKSEQEVHDRMRADAKLEPVDLGRIELKDEPVANVLLTGPTGFFGPFLLSSLLRQTPHKYFALTRATDPGHGMERIRDAMRRAGIWTPLLAGQLESRVRVVCGDLQRDNLGLPPQQWTSLTRRIHAVFHNAAFVNYVLNYDVLKPTNVDGMRTMLRFSHTARLKEFHHVSSTFIFGWTFKGFLIETDNNDEMTSLDFGYAQTKWVAEQLVLAAEKKGLKVRIYRPSLISASSDGVGDPNDVAVRLLAFMINHGIAVDTRNQVSILPVDVAADNIAAIFKNRDSVARTLHITADGYYNIADLTRLVSEEHGYGFTYFDIPSFIDEMNRRCTKDDPLYPLLDFFNRSASKIAAMQLKRYRNDRYREARVRSGIGRSDPPLKDTVSYLIAYMHRQGLIRPSARAAGDLANL